jgi:putative ABC transport system substrate-binding protein
VSVKELGPPAAGHRGHPAITRRAFVGTVIGGLIAAPLAAGAQQAGRVFRIGILANYRFGKPDLWAIFIQGLRDLGYVEGQNIAIEWRVSEGKYERLPDLAAELARLLESR